VEQAFRLAARSTHTESPFLAPQAVAQRSGAARKDQRSAATKRATALRLDDVSVVYAADLTKSGERFQNFLYARPAGANKATGDFVHAEHLVGA
jgi:hypothetical protein